MPVDAGKQRGKRQKAEGRSRKVKGRRQSAEGYLNRNKHFIKQGAFFHRQCKRKEADMRPQDRMQQRQKVEGRAKEQNGQRDITRESNL